MTEFFNALKNFKPNTEKEHTVNIDGHVLSVSLELKKEIIKTGIENWEYKENKLTKKIKKKTQRKFKELKSDLQGYHFLDNDPYWPIKIDKGGYTWQLQSE